VRHRTPPQQQGPIRPRLWWWQTRPRHPRQGQWRTVVFSARAAVPPAVPATRDCLPLLLGLVEPLVHHLLDQGDGLSRASPQPPDPSHRPSGTPKGPSNRSFQFRHVIFVSRTTSRTGSSKLVKFEGENKQRNNVVRVNTLHPFTLHPFTRTPIHYIACRMPRCAGLQMGLSVSPKLNCASR
jgi:hypothetical protein